MRAHLGPRICASTPCQAGAERKECPILNPWKTQYLHGSEHLPNPRRGHDLLCPAGRRRCCLKVKVLSRRFDEIIYSNKSASHLYENGTDNMTSPMHRTVHGLHELPEALKLLLT